LKLIKNTAINYPLLHESVEWIGSGFKNQKKNELNVFEKSDDFSKNTRLLKTIFQLKSFLEEENSVEKIISFFQNLLKDILFLKEVQIFYFEENYSSLIPLTQVCDINYTNSINKAFADGIIDWVFEKRQTFVLPEVKKSNTNESSLNMILFPVYSSKKPKGILSVITPQKSVPSNSFETEAVNMLLAMITNKIDLIREKEKINSVYTDLQLYQSKLANDFKLSAIGELTAGLVEDVISPVQVVLSSTKMIENDYENVDKEILRTIYSQLDKIQNVVSRLSKFANINNRNSSVYPADLNSIITDYYNVVLSTLNYKDYECILDLEPNIPPILTKSTYIHQLLTNFFSIMKSENGGGILIQSKFSDEKIIVNFITTDLITASGLDSKQKTNLKMMENLMNLHEGTLKIHNTKSGGTNFVLTFPLRRKIRK
jgi:K+-sensing histidine kinase KdpD